MPLLAACNSDHRSAACAEVMGADVVVNGLPDCLLGATVSVGGSIRFLLAPSVGRVRDLSDSGLFVLEDPSDSCSASNQCSGFRALKVGQVEVRVDVIPHCPDNIACGSAAQYHFSLAVTEDSGVGVTLR